MAGGLLGGLGPNRYERTARLAPALIVCLPVFTTVAVWLPEVWTVLGGLLSLAVVCGLPFLLSNTTRSFGQRLEARLRREAGGTDTMRMLRHRDGTVSSVTKARYHAALRSRKISLPTATEEQADPAAADLRYASAVDWLLSRTRGEGYELLLEENIGYGFRRNLVGMKIFGLPLCAAVLLVNGALLFAYESMSDGRWMAAVALEVAAAVLLAAWLFLLRKPFVEEASRTYARRLLEHCDRLEPTS